MYMNRDSDSSASNCTSSSVPSIFYLHRKSNITIFEMFFVSQVYRTILKWYCAVVYSIKYSENTSNNVVFTSDGDRTRLFISHFTVFCFQTGS